MNPPHEEKHNEGYNGIYSYFIRGINPRVSSEVLNNIKQYAVKVVESRESILIVGRNWVIVGKKVCGSDYEGFEVRCFKDVCEPYEEITPRYLEDIIGAVESVEVSCNVQKTVIRDIADYLCRVSYNYCIYNVVVAITIDPHDIHILKNDKELQLLLDLIPSETLLVRPM